MESAGVSLSVSFAADVANYRGFLWAVDGCTQPTRVHIDTVGLRNEFIVPFILDKSCARQQLAAPLHHLLEQLEFARRQINLPVAALRSAIDEIKLQWSYAQNCFTRFDRRPKQDERIAGSGKPAG